MTIPETTDDTYASVDILASDFVARYRDGDRPTIQEYANRHPDLSETIQSVFPLVLSVEQVKVDQQATNDGSATLAGRELDRLGDFQLVREIGRGGMGIVYEAQQESLSRNVAVKVLPKQSLLDEKSLQRFQHEAKTAAAMHHSNIVPIFGTGETDGTHYLVMQLVRGESLDQIIRANSKTMDVHTAAELTAQIADGLAYAHECGVLHRDVKPANILIDQDGIAQLTDFGIARNIHDDPTMTHVLSGSPRYMAPERFEGKSDERCDIYGLGLTLYEALSGQPALNDFNASDLVLAAKNHQIEPLDNLRHDLPNDLKIVVAKSIAANPIERYQSASDFRDDIRRFLNDEPIRARRTTVIQKLTRWCRRNPALAASTGIAMAAMLVATVASSVGFAMTTSANRRTNLAFDQSRQTVDLALQSLGGVADIVSLPASALGEMGGLESAPFLLNPSPHAAQLLQNIQPLYQRLANQSPTRPDIFRQMIEAGLRLSQIQQQLEQTKASIETLQRSIQLLRDRSDIAGLRRSEKQLLFARVYNELGKAYALELDHLSSDTAFEQAIVAIEAVDAPNENHLFQLAYANIALGDPPPQLRRKQSGEESEQRMWRKRLSIAEDILNEINSNGNNTSQVVVLRSRIDLAQSRLARRPMLRQFEFTSAVAILRDKLASAPEDHRVRFALVESLASVNLRRQAGTERSANEAQQRLIEAIDELKLLRSKNPKTPVFAVSEIHILHKLSNLARSDGEYELAVSQLNKAILIQTSLVEAAPKSMPHHCWRALLYRSISDVHRAQGNHALEQQAVLAAVADMESIDEKSKTHPFAVQTQQIIQNLVNQISDDESQNDKL